MIYSISNSWKYISISVAFIIIVCVINTRSTTTNTDTSLYNFCRQSNLRHDITHKEQLTHGLTESGQVPHIKAKTGDSIIHDYVWDGVPVKGAFYMVVQNTDLHYARATIRSLEDRFNSGLNTSYPWILLNSQPFTHKFKKYVRLAANDPTKVFFGQIDLNAWALPYWIETNRVEAAMTQMLNYQVENSDSLYYHQLQRYQTGLFMHHSLFDTVEYIWHVEIGSTYTCDVFQNDPFQKMKNSKKKIGFALASTESSSGMFSLWPASLQFMKQYSQWILPVEKTIMSWLVTLEREFTFCNVWTSFQIVEKDFLKSPEYQIYFQYLDYVGGFFYERWTTASVRSIAAAMFLKTSDLHFFEQVGYAGKKGEYCPLNKKLLESSCTCQYQNTLDLRPNSCNIELIRLTNPGTINAMVDFAKSKLNLKKEALNFASQFLKKNPHSNKQNLKKNKNRVSNYYCSFVIWFLSILFSYIRRVLIYLLNLSYPRFQQ